MEGGAENDFLFGEEDNDVIRGGTGDDVIEGEGGDDTLFGGPGADYLDGGAGNDSLDGTNGALTGGTDGLEFDTLVGGEGDDTLVIGSNDIATGGAGADVFVTGTWAEGTDGINDAPYISDFTVGEDTMVIMVPAGYAGAGDVVVENVPGATTALVRVLLDGVVVAHIAGQTAAAIPLSSLSIVEAAA
ncbi:hypothetical protein RXV86_16165 [Alisedimentitalea sp. MJ-SS2]|nr:hypothetical protein [Alisedimentitalea sp. MJ-SS2]MDU8928929.1 hypothetical protein [Alisedimentitalea sp. MJ-SS2]